MSNENSSREIVYTQDEVIIKEIFILKNKEKVGGGSFGQIYKGYNKKTGKQLAFKMELSTTKTPLLQTEYKILKTLQGNVGFTNVYYFSSMGEDKIMVMDLLGQNLENLMKKNSAHCLSLKSVLMCAEQMITRLNCLHEHDYIHRDLKPENWVIGLEKEENLIYLIDFGLSKKYKDSKGEHIPYKEGKSILGTIRYVSIYTHFGIEQSRRDDIESLGYILVYLAKGVLPWQGLKAKTQKERYKLIMNKKMENKPELLCQGLPDAFCQFFDYIRGVQFNERPDYGFLKGLFHKTLAKINYQNDSIFDWCKNTKPVDLYQNHVPKYNMFDIIKKLESLAKKEDGTQQDD